MTGSHWQTSENAVSGRTLGTALVPLWRNMTKRGPSHPTATGIHTDFASALPRVTFPQPT